METVSLNIASNDYGRYTIDQNAKLFISADALPLTNEITGQVLQNTGESAPSLVAGIHGNAIKLQPKTKFSSPIFLKSVTEFSLGFWLKPANITPNTNTLTGLPIYYQMSLFDKAEFVYSSVNGYTSVSDGSFVVYEESRESNFNVLRIVLIGDDLRETNLETEKYEAGIYHHFWITYYGPARKLQVFIDGKLASLFSLDGYQIPTSINDNSVIPFNINKSAVGYSSLLRNNSGTLDEVVFFNTFIIDIEKISTIINYGAKYIIDQSLSYRSNVHNCFAFDDPTSLGITSVLGNGKNFYVGRNDGKVYKGDRNMWQVRRDFSNGAELKYVKRNVLDKETNLQIENGALRLFKGSVRI